MKKIVILIAVAPSAAFGQSSIDDILHPKPDYSGLIAAVVCVYILSCIIVAGAAYRRGWEAFGVFVVAIISTPVVAAILYSPFNRKDIEIQLIARIAIQQGVSKEEIIKFLESKGIFYAASPKKEESEIG